MIINNEIIRKFGALNDVVMDSECNIFFVELTAGIDESSIKQPAGYDGVYSIDLITNEMNIIESSIYGANGIGLSNDGKLLMIGNFKSKNFYTFDDHAALAQESMIDKFKYDQLYWKQYFRNNTGNADSSKFSMNSSSIFLNASDYHNINATDPLIKFAKYYY